jgi:hypothetical protein
MPARRATTLCQPLVLENRKEKVPHRFDRITPEAAMSIPLTSEQQQALQRSKKPLRFIDPDSKREYILLPAELYERKRRVAVGEMVDPSLYEFEELAEPS